MRWVEEAAGLPPLLTTGDKSAQVGLAASGTLLGDALNAAFESVSEPGNLAPLFGAGVLRNAAEPFVSYYLRRLRAALAAFPAVRNPFIWLMLAGRFPPDVATPWLQAESPARMPELKFTNASVQGALAGFVSEFDVVDLSNVLDDQDEPQAPETLELAYHALRPRGCVVVRQLNSRHKLASLEGFDWLRDDAQSWLKRDRSFIYSGLLFGVRPA